MMEHNSHTSKHSMPFHYSQSHSLFNSRGMEAGVIERQEEGGNLPTAVTMNFKRLGLGGRAVAIFSSGRLIAEV